MAGIIVGYPKGERYSKSTIPRQHIDMYKHDNRIVVTLDAGGTNFVFGAMRGCEFITEPITYHSNAHDLDLCLDTTT